MRSLLFWKMIRDMRRSLTTYLVCVLIITIGFCGYCVLSIMGEKLTDARDFFYEQSNFSDGFASVVKAPAALSEKLEKIPGIETAQGRLVKTVTVDMEAGDRDQPQLRLVSFQRGGMNVPYLTAGYLPENKKELVAGADFLKVYHLKRGDQIKLMTQGRTIPFTVSAIGSSPESIYLIKNIEELLPDPSTYDMAFVEQRTMELLFDSVGTVNEFVFRFEAGADFEQLKPQIEEVLKPYGCIRVYDREGEMSSFVLQSELEQIEQMTTAIPFLFLTVAAVILYISIYRMVQQQRTQVGTLMALGVGRFAICFHYMAYGGITGFLGGLTGGILGNLSAGPLIDFYMVYFKLPVSSGVLSLSYLIYGAVASTIFCGAVAAFCVTRLWRLRPAEALRPAQPESGRKTVLENIPGLVTVLTEPGIMGFRNVFRNKRRSLLSVFGIGCAFMIMTTLASMSSMMDVFMFDFFEKTQRQDVTVHFSQPVSGADGRRLVSNPAFSKVEGVLEFGVSLKSQGNEVDGSIQGIETDSTLCRLYDDKDQQVFVPSQGMVLSYHMARQLEVEIGDWIELTTKDLKPRTTTVQATGLCSQYMGDTVYMSLEAAGKAGGYGNVYTSMLVQGEKEVIGKEKADWLKAEAVSTVEQRQQKVDNMRSLLGNMGSVMTSLAVMSLFIGFAVIYTSSLVTFEEMKREMAVMEVLGVEKGQCLDVIFVGQVLLSLGGILVGIPMTMAISGLVSATMGTDLYTIPGFVDGKSIILSVALTFMALWLSKKAGLRKLKKLTPVDLLRERE